MSSGIEYPTKKDLEWFIEYLQKKNDTHYLKKYLPKTDAKWTERVMHMVELIQLPYYPKDLYYQGALLFYKINKAHNEIDSNKRSAIIATYLFFILNSKYFHSPNEVRLMAKKIAKSKGRKNHDKWIEKVRRFFIEKLKPI